MTFNSKFAHLVGIALIGTVLAGSHAFANPPEQSTTRTGSLSLADLNLARDADLKIARERVHQMAVNLCERLRDPLSLSHHEAFLECVARATAGAEPKLEQLAAAQRAAVTLAATR